MPGKRTLRAGDWVEVLSFDKVLATLDAKGRLEGLPFMPEMIRHCGRRFQVAKSAHKTCDPTGCMNMLRMADAVHLATRCDGSAHDGCEARCQFFWKTAWLKPVEGPGRSDSSSPSREDTAAVKRLCAETRYMTENGLRYCCQATEIVRATQILSPIDFRQYIRDISSRNIRLSFFMRHFSVVIAKMAISRIMRYLGRPIAEPGPCITISASDQNELSKHYGTGEFVKVRPAIEIKSTLGRKRGPALEPEMLRHCGRTYRVLYRVNRIIDERSGKMLKLANDCVVLDGIICEGLDNSARLFCPRSCYYFWREAWLQPANGRSSNALDTATGTSTSPANSEARSSAETVANNVS